MVSKRNKVNNVIVSTGITFKSKRFKSATNHPSIPNLKKKPIVLLLCLLLRFVFVVVACLVLFVLIDFFRKKRRVNVTLEN